MQAAVVMMALASAGFSATPMRRGRLDTLFDDEPCDPLLLIIGNSVVDRPEPKSAKPSVHVYRAVTHIDTPKPISKRKARRLRGAARALASSEQSS